MSKASRPLPEVLEVPDFDAQSFANTLRAMTKTSRLLCEILDVLDPDVQSFATRCRP